MKCRVCGGEITGSAGYMKMGRVCSKNCWQDIYNEPEIEHEDDDDDDGDE